MSSKYSYAERIRGINGEFWLGSSEKLKFANRK